MIAFLWNLLLALAWVALTGDFSGSNFLVGYVIGYFVLLMAGQQMRLGSTYSRKAPKIIGFIAFFIYDLVKANMRVAYDVVTPTHKMRPGVVAIPLTVDTDAEITILANLISVTPGTLSLDVSSDRKVLYIHAMYIDSEHELEDSIKDLERRVMDILR